MASGLRSALGPSSTIDPKSLSSQVQRPFCGGQRGGRYGGVLIAGGVCRGVSATADGRRCGEKSRSYWER